MNVNVLTSCFLCRKKDSQNEPRHNVGTITVCLKSIFALNIYKIFFRFQEVVEGEKIKESRVTCQECRELFSLHFSLSRFQAVWFWCIKIKTNAWFHLL